MVPPAIPVSWVKLPCQDAVDTPQKPTRHGSDEETNLSQSESDNGIEAVEKQLASKSA